MIRRWRAATQAPARDAGMSLVELLVAMFVASILMAGVATVFSGTMNGVRTVNVKTSTSADARISMEAISRTLRVAIKPSSQPSALILARDQSVSFYALLNRTGATTTPLETLVEYAWDGTCLTEAQTPGRLNALGVRVWDTGRTSKCLARTSVAPSFAYHLDGATASALPVPVAGLAAAVRPTVKSVQVTVTVQDPNNLGVKAALVTTRITLINVVNG